jgi:prophage regulatory protein
MANRLIPLSAVSDARRNQSKAGIYNNIKDGLLPHPVKLGRSSAWPESEIEAINAAIIAGKSDDEIRAPVKGRHAQHTSQSAVDIAVVRGGASE